MKQKTDNVTSWRRTPSAKKNAFAYLDVGSPEYAYLGHFRQDRFMHEGHNVKPKAKPAAKPKIPKTVPQPGNETPAWGKEPGQRPLKPTGQNPTRKPTGGGKKPKKPVEPVTPALPAPAPITINFPTATAPTESPINIYEAPAYEGPTAADLKAEREAAEAHDKAMAEAAALRARDEEAMGRNRTKLQEGLDTTFIPGRNVNDLVR